MPALRPCLVCRALSRATRCPRHAIQRGSSGSSGRQATFRRRALKQTGGRCAVCGSDQGVEAHHLRPLAMGGTDADGGVPLCRQHHVAAHGW